MLRLGQTSCINQNSRLPWSPEKLLQDPLNMFQLSAGHPLSAPASRMTCDNDPSMLHLWPHKVKPGVCRLSAEDGKHGCVCVYGGPLSVLSDRAELLLVPKGWWSGTEEGTALVSFSPYFPTNWTHACLCFYHQRYSFVDYKLNAFLPHPCRSEAVTNHSFSRVIFSRDEELVHFSLACLDQVHNLPTGNPVHQTPGRHLG